MHPRPPQVNATERVNREINDELERIGETVESERRTRETFEQKVGVGGGSLGRGGLGLGVGGVRNNGVNCFSSDLLWPCWMLFLGGCPRWETCQLCCFLVPLTTCRRFRGY